MPTVRTLSIIFIEFVRGVPLITVLFMASVMLPLFVPDAYSPNKLLRALVGVGLFAAAYMAEVVRAGLAAIPKGQFEGAMAVGLSYSQMMRLIILPQALKITIPNIVNTYIGLFKDTTLVVDRRPVRLPAHHRGVAHRSEMGGADHVDHRLRGGGDLLFHLLLRHVALCAGDRSATGESRETVRLMRCQ